jgi:superfamily II RNA helicase
MNYKSFTLDKFQIDAIEAINKNNSVIVSAATGTGKTLIADYVVTQAIKAGKGVIYTSPIKALSNQKFREFTEAFGDNVGLLTGDVSINSKAPILIMTTEIYRNMLLEQKNPFPKLSYVVFDEIHYINDIERGTVWEESIIFSPDHVRFLCLSATIPNYQQFADWISSIKKHTVETVNYMKRAVPLKHEVYDVHNGICEIKQLEQDIGFSVGRGRRGKRLPDPDYIPLIRELNASGNLPAIFFTFSRKDAFQKAYEMGRKFDYTSSDEKKQIIEFLRAHIPKNISNMESVQQMRQFLPKGFGVHHAGILPAMKEVVEKLFGMGLLKVLFATETFAVGINMPAKAVIMGSIKKYDGFSVRYLSTKEYFQMAGRAGRRGIDTEGRVIVIVNRNDVDLHELKRVTSEDVEPIISRFTIGYNTVLNLIKNHKKDERVVVLKSNFGYFLKRLGNQSRIDQSYINYLRILDKMNYVNYSQEEDDYAIAWKGMFATHIFSNELVITELYYSDVLLNDIELLVFLTSLEYESRITDKFDERNVSIEGILRKLSKNKYVFSHTKKRSLKKVYKLISTWANGGSFEQLLDICNLAEGDIIRLFRRIIDVLRQIRSALMSTEGNEAKIAQVTTCIQKLDRDIVSVVF